jgi:hypothetical protein
LERLVNENESRYLGYSAKELRKGGTGYTAEELRAGSYTVTALREGGYTASEVCTAGLPKKGRGTISLHRAH